MKAVVVAEAASEASVALGPALRGSLAYAQFLTTVYVFAGVGVYFGRCSREGWIQKPERQGVVIFFNFKSTIKHLISIRN